MIRILNKAGIDTENMLVQEKEWSTMYILSHIRATGNLTGLILATVNTA